MPRRSVRNSSLLPCLLATAALLTAWPLQAATFTVDSTQHGTDANAATTTLVEAIQQANLAGGANVIELAANGLYLSDDTVFIDGTSAGRTMYPAITSNITIRANGATLEATGKNARFFYISGSGALTLEDINLVGGRAKGGDGAGGNFMGGGGGAGMGGAIFVNGTTASLTMRRAAIFNCVAQGGPGTSSVNIGGPGGGGGGMGGDAGNLNTASAQSGGGGPRSAASGATGGDGVGGNAGANNGGFGGGGGGGISGAAGNGGFGGGGGGGWQSGGSGGTPGTGGFGGGGGGIFSGTGAAGGTFGGQGGAYNGSGYGTGGGGAGLGGAIFNYQGVVTLENVSLLSNSAKGGAGSALNGIGAGSGVGGGIFNYDGSVTLKHVTAYTNTVSTFTPNPGQATGGALYNYDAPGGATPSATIYNSILANSTFTNATGVEVAGSGTLVAAGAANSSIITSSSGLTGTVRTASPQLALIERKSGLYLFRPTPGSPAIDNGDGSNSLDTDSSGTARPQGSGVDIGAAEGAFSTAINLTTGMLLVTDTQADAVFAIDPATGNRTLVSRLNYVGTGPDIGNPRGIALDANRNIYVVNTSPVVAIVKIDPTTGNRTTVSSSASAPAVGTGPAFSTPSGITIRPSDGMLLVSDTGGPNGGAGGDAIFVVDPVTGNRTILSDDVTPDTVNALTTANTIIYHSTLGILVADNTGVDTVTRINGSTGARTIFSSNTVPNATNPITNPFGLAEESDGSILLVESNATVSANRQLLRLDKTTGARAVVSNLATAGNFQGLVVSPNGGIYVTMTTTPMQIWSVDASTGAVATVAGNSIGDGVLFGGATGSIGFNIGLAVVPGSASTAPTVTTPTSASVTTTAATLGGDVTSEGSAAVTVRGVVYAATATNATPALGGTGVTNLASTGTTGVFTVSATGLTPGTSYSYRAYATNSVGTSYSSPSTFTTTADTTPPTVVSVVRKTPSQQSIAAGTTVTFEVTFSEPVIGVTVDRFAVHTVNGGTVTGTVSNVSAVSSSVYDVTVTLTGGAGEFTLSVVGAPI